MKAGRSVKLKVNTKPVLLWIAQNHPNGIEKLVVKARVSSSLIRNLMHGKAPSLPLQRWAVAQAIEISEDDLFPTGVEEKKPA